MTTTTPVKTQQDLPEIFDIFHAALIRFENPTLDNVIPDDYLRLLNVPNADQSIVNVLNRPVQPLTQFYNRIRNSLADKKKKPSRQQSGFKQNIFDKMDYDFIQRMGPTLSLQRDMIFKSRYAHHRLQLALETAHRQGQADLDNLTVALALLDYRNFIQDHFSHKNYTRFSPLIPQIIDILTQATTYVNRLNKTR